MVCDFFSGFCQSSLWVSLSKFTDDMQMSSQKIVYYLFKPLLCDTFTCVDKVNGMVIMVYMNSWFVSQHQSITVDYILK